MSTAIISSDSPPNRRNNLIRRFAGDDVYIWWMDENEDGKHRWARRYFLHGQRPVPKRCSDAHLPVEKGDRWKYTKCDRCQARLQDNGAGRAIWTQPDVEAHLDVYVGGTWSRRILGAEIKLGTGGSENPLGATVHLGPLGSIYFGQRGWLTRLMTARLEYPTRGGDTDSRKIGADLSFGGEQGYQLRWSLWEPQDRWSRRDPQWWSGSIDFHEKIFGRAKYTKTAIEKTSTVIPLPEGNYAADVEIERCEWRWRFGKRKVIYRTDITPDAPPPPIPGKGENSYDCGDDSYYSSSAPCRGPESEWVAQAVGGYVESVLTTRQRYGGKNWVPAAGWPHTAVPTSITGAQA